MKAKSNPVLHLHRQRINNLKLNTIHSSSKQNLNKITLKQNYKQRIQYRKRKISLVRYLNNSNKRINHSYNKKHLNNSNSYSHSNPNRINSNLSHKNHQDPNNNSNTTTTLLLMISALIRASQLRSHSSKFHNSNHKNNNHHSTCSSNNNNPLSRGNHRYNNLKQAHMLILTLGKMKAKAIKMKKLTSFLNHYLIEVEKLTIALYLNFIHKYIYSNF